MSSVRIRTRTTRAGRRRYMVAYRLGGRYGRDRSAGTFPKLTHARQRQAKVQELIARGEHDQIPELVNPAAQPASAGSWTGLHEQWLDGMHNLEPSTKRTYRNHGQALAEAIGDRDPTMFGWRDCRDLVRRAHRAGTSPRHRQGLHRHIQSSCWTTQGVDPNPARDRRVKLPRQEQKQPDIPPRTHIQAIRNHLPQHLLLAFDTLEATGIRVGELTSLTWGDLDTAESRVRISRGQDPLGQALGEATPRADRQDRQPPGPTRGRTPQGDACSPTPATARSDGRSRQACEHAGTPRYTPHDLRHRWISLALKRGTPTRRGRPTSRPRPPSNHPQHLQPRHHPTRRHPPLAWDTYGHRTDTTQGAPEPTPDPETRGHRADTTPTQ